MELLRNLPSCNPTTFANLTGSSALDAQHGLLRLNKVNDAAGILLFIRKGCICIAGCRGEAWCARGVREDGWGGGCTAGAERRDVTCVERAGQNTKTICRYT